MSAPKILLKSHRCELRRENSRFIGIGCISQSLNEFKLQKDLIESEFSDSNHVAFAYRLLDPDSQSIQTRFYDAGEPSGTAGKPILMHIEGNELLNVTLFVVRYFGGVKLGAGGLVKAYGDTARLLIQEAEWGAYLVYRVLRFAIPYSEQNRLEYLVRKHEAEIVERGFGESVSCVIRIAEKNIEVFKDGLPLSWIFERDS